jgi:phosphoglycolate phosphatase
MIKLIIFDLDGTLVDSLKDITASLNWAICPKQFLSTFQVSKIIGEGAEELVRKAMTMSELSYDKRFLDEYLKIYSEHMYDNTKLYPGVFRAIAPLLKYHKMAVISNKSRDLAARVLHHFNLWMSIDIVLGGDSLPEKKPSPMPCLHILDKLKVKPEEAVLVGDTEADIKCGKAAGVKTVAAIYGYGKPGFQWEADAIISDITQLPKIVKEMTHG